MANEYTKSRDLGKDMGKFCSKILVATGHYYNIAFSSISSAYKGFTEETAKSLNSFKSENSLDECVDVELSSTNDLDASESKDTEPVTHSASL